MARTARTQHGIATRHIRRRTGTTELSPRAGAGIKRGWRPEVGPIENIEELRAELGAVRLLELPLFGDREVRVEVVRQTKNVAACVADRPVSGESECRPGGHVAADIIERSEREPLELGVSGVGRRGCIYADSPMPVSLVG